MVYDLVQSDDCLSVRMGVWPHVLYLAQLGGWQPAGTKLDYVLEDLDGEPIDWDGSYVYTQGQFVTDDDARALADGLENWLDCTTALDIVELFDEKAKESKPAEVFKRLLGRRLRLLILLITEPHAKQALRLFQRQKDSGYLREFIRFCGRGGFSIY